MFREREASGIQGRFRMALGRSGRALHGAEGLPWAMPSDGSERSGRAEGAGSAAHGTERLAHETYILKR